MNPAPLKIAVLGSRNRFQELLMQFVEKDYPAGILVDIDEADVCILDFDGYGSERLLEEQRQQRPQQPMILLALQQPQHDNCIWLKKPLQSRQLTEALDHLRHQPIEEDLKVVVSEKKHTPLHQTAKGLAVKHSVNHRMVHSVTTSSAKYYEPVEYLQGLLIKSYRQAVTTGITLRIDAGWEPIFVYPRKRLVWVDADDRKLQAFCHLTIRKFAQMTGDMATGPTITPVPEAKMEDIPDAAQRMDAFLWKVSWWNSAGHLPRGVRSSQVICLKRWPNLTRLWCQENALRMAALLYQQPMTPVAAVSALGIAAEEVYSFISAARAIGLIERIDDEPKTQRDEPKSAKSSGGFLGRILQRLRRG